MNRLARAHWPPVALGLLLALLLALLSLSGVFSRADWLGYHALFELRGPVSPPRTVSLVAIDEVSLEGLGVWPLPRSVFARLIDGLLGAGARVVALDVTFPQAQAEKTDQALQAALARHPGQVVLAADLQPSQNGREESEQMVLPLAIFRRHAAVGVVNLPFDEDGGIHRFVSSYEGIDPEHPEKMKVYEGFDAAIARLYAGLAPAPGSQLINYVGPPGTFRTESLIQVLDALRAGNKDYLARFEGQAVLVGATSTRMQDLYPTPFSATVLNQSLSHMAGVEIHANALTTLLRHDAIKETPFALRAALLAALGLLGGIIFSWLPPWRGLLALGGGAFLFIFSASAIFSLERLWWPTAAPLALWGLLYGAGLIEHFTRSEASRRFYLRTFERYVSPEIVKEVLRHPKLAPKLGGERREVSVLFSDIRNFTSISEVLSPEEVVAFLNAYLTAMADIILENGGCIDKYIGDAILAVWGNVTPMAQASAAAAATRTALGMKRRVAELREEWKNQGFPLIEIGVGVNTGEAVVGNIGSPRKLEFAVIGDSINVASRLEGLTKEYGGAVLVSGRTRELLGDRFACTFLDEVKVKGRQAPVAIYRVDAEAPASPPGV